MATSKKEFDNALIQIREVMEEHKISIEDLKREFTDEISIPVSIFNSNCSPLGAVCVYLKEHHNLGFSQIAKKMNRDPRTIWLTYQKNQKNRLKISFEEVIGLDTFADRKLSVMEHLSMQLRGKGLKLTEIANLTGKNPKTIWSFYNRAKKKC